MEPQSNDSLSGHGQGDLLPYLVTWSTGDDQDESSGDDDMSASGRQDHPIVSVGGSGGGGSLVPSGGSPAATTTATLGGGGGSGRGEPVVVPQLAAANAIVSVPPMRTTTQTNTQPVPPMPQTTTTNNNASNNNLSSCASNTDDVNHHLPASSFSSPSAVPNAVPYSATNSANSSTVSNNPNSNGMTTTNHSTSAANERLNKQKPRPLKLISPPGTDYHNGDTTGSGGGGSIPTHGSAMGSGGRQHPHYTGMVAHSAGPHHQQQQYQLHHFHHLQQQQQQHQQQIHQQASHGISHHHSSSMGGGSSTGGSHELSPMATDDMLQLMHQINANVKASNFNANLANLIFRLCNELKNAGEVMEQTHKEEMNKVFVSLRQACCRDSGQLGTPCRIKIMELIELRAMGWRPNLAHSQYYISRTQKDGPETSAANDVGPAPVSAPPFGTIPMNPFAMGFQPQPIAHAGVIPAAGHAMHPGPELVTAGATQPQFYLIPASNVAHTQAGIAFVTPSNATLLQPSGMPGHGPPPSAPPMVTSGVTTVLTPGLPQTPGGIAASYSPPGMLNSISSPVWPKGAVIKPSGRFSKPTKVPGKNQYRDEIIIRNADSGKIMGIKGRRIAIIEELSKTVVSFQKVPPGAKERTLTITGPTEESIEQAKALVDQTIRRNASPTRADSECGDTEPAGLRESEEGDVASAGSDDLFSEMPISDQDIIGLTCTNPKLLQAAKDALREYFERHGALRRSYTDGGLSREDRKLRRQSMPPISQPNMEVAAVTGEASAQSPSVHSATVCFLDDAKSPRHKRFQSTPNLAQVPEEQISGIGTPRTPKSPLSSTVSNPEGATTPGIRDGAGDAVIVDKTGGAAVFTEPGKGGIGHMRVVYTREFLLQCSLYPMSQMPPPNMAHVTNETSEVLRDLPGRFDPNEYKDFCAKLKQSQMAAAAAAAAVNSQGSPYGGNSAPLSAPTQFIFA